MKFKISPINTFFENPDCFLIGGGASILRQFGFPLDTAPKTIPEYLQFGEVLNKSLHGKNIIGINNAFMLGDLVHIAFWGDRSQYLNHKQEYDSFMGLKFTCNSLFDFPEYKKLGITYIPRHTTKTEGLTKDSRYLSWNKNSGCAAINLAYHLGAKRIFLLGFDMQNDPDTGRTHWHYDHPAKTGPVKSPNLKVKHKLNPPNHEFSKRLYMRHMTGIKKIQDDADSLGIKIINLNLDSSITVFEKGKLENYL